MFLRDDNNVLVDSEFSLDLFGDSTCVVVESSGGQNISRNVVRRNPEYNKLLQLLLARLATAQTRLTAVVLDSNRVANIPVQDRIVNFDEPYPIDLSTVNIDSFRRALGRTVKLMHRSPDAKSGGNNQKRIRLVLDRPVNAEQLTTSSQGGALEEIDHTPGLTETEKLYIQKARIGQGLFRTSLLEEFGSTCPILGIVNPELLIASHIKPWAVCTNQERLDPKNGILLSPLFDRLFDRGLATFGADGELLIACCLTEGDLAKCQLGEVGRISLPSGRQHYMRYHRRCEFRGS